ncbi:hypothetical protein KOM00_15515 [Geomonas sp. Red69]|uniref:hypothetical protein n=1 Tax=Geomonas diazotrophica TaxID=2843197 RepID=UPI001C10EAA6|nr:MULTISPECIES: hypothetical protein [Geomonas]MBU5638138.1 hypothetical protein [Geomonas diazotrophica]QXE84946.1 hypothetical protein KP003_11075 [Geomonas nitrogeniifigens]
MGKMLLTVLVLGLLGVARPGFSYSLISDSAQVGGSDNLLQYADLSNSSQAEIDWIQSFFPDASISLKQEDFQGGDWQKVDYGDLWPLYLTTSPTISWLRPATPARTPITSLKFSMTRPGR